MYFPTWIDLKGQDAVPETVHHCVCMVDPAVDTQWKSLRQHIITDGVHEQDRIQPESHSSGKSLPPPPPLFLPSRRDESLHVYQSQRSV
ncbi:ATP-dependent RNA helicase ddx1 [Plakobranchus ocellatus]|uniref:ATP-dependent RNA helicase ddx1 n=1 Tax=Plakobranchus ocellatus TaxID=259542 RepID=A0AAV4DRA7_9GAST|nr:ATP-dependent RNA helicase ddx1 [Plakobranchus ocellatus]